MPSMSPRLRQYERVRARDAELFKDEVWSKIDFLHQGTRWQVTRFKGGRLLYMRRNKLIKYPPEALVRKVTEKFALEDMKVVHES